MTSAPIETTPAASSDDAAKPQVPATSSNDAGLSAEKTKAPATSDLDAALSELRDRARPFARLPARDKARLLRDVLARTIQAAPRMVALGCQAKGIDPSSALAGEEWFGGPVTIVNHVAALVAALEDIAKRGAPRLPFGSVRQQDGCVNVQAFPMRGSDARLLAGFSCDVRLAKGTQKRDVRAQQAAFYQVQDPEGAVSLVLGAGNVASISAMDTLHELFVEGRVVVLKLSPVNEYLAPVLNEMLAPLVNAGFVRIVCGDGQVGAYLTQHEAVSHVHITGSQTTHDTIVWGKPGPEQDERKRRNEPLLGKTITSELGNISPVIVVPYLFSERELWFQARNIATQIVNNASFNCNAAKMLVLPRKWAQRDRFVAELCRALEQVRPRKAYYPGALDRHATLTQGREHVRRIGECGPDELPWTLIEHLDPMRQDEPLFSTEPFCALVSEVSVGSDDPVEFLSAATKFCNETLWGTLSASIVCHGVLEDDPVVGRALERAIDELRYGAVALNHWPAFVYGTVTAPWGGHPSSTLANVQSGKGFVHNTLMLGNIEKAIFRGPLVSFPRPPLFFDHRKMHVVAERLMHYNADPGWLRLPSVASAAMTG